MSNISRQSFHGFHSFTCQTSGSHLISRHKWNTPNHALNSIPISSQQPTTSSHSLFLEHMWNSHQIDFDDFVDEMAEKSIYFEGFYDIYNLLFMLRCDARKMSRMEIVKLKSQIKILLYKANMLNAPIKNNISSSHSISSCKVFFPLAMFLLNFLGVDFYFIFQKEFLVNFIKSTNLIYRL